jgi:hypothetical protein
MPSLVSYALKALININSSGSLKKRDLVESRRGRFIIKKIKNLGALVLRYVKLLI